MTLRNVRQNGVRAVIATCLRCGHQADVNLDALPAATVTKVSSQQQTVNMNCDSDHRLAALSLIL
jgi:hypothetical protein